MTKSDDRLIVALDVPNALDGLALAEQLGDSVSFYKIGLGMLTGGGLALADELKQAGKAAGHRHDSRRVRFLHQSREFGHGLFVKVEVNSGVFVCQFSHAGLLLVVNLCVKFWICAAFCGMFGGC